MSAFDQFSPRLKTFTRAYLKNELYRALALYGFFLLLAFSCMVSLEYVLYASSGVRLLFILSFLGYALCSAFFLLRKPLLAFFRPQKYFTYRMASILLMTRFPEIKDRLQNVLDLDIFAKESLSADKSLVEAAMDQKISQFSHLNFIEAIPKKTTLRAVLIFLLFLCTLISSVFFAPHFIKDSTQRILFYQRHFERPSPYQFVIISQPLLVEQFSDFEFKVRSVGEQHPDHLLIEVASLKQSMTRVSADTFVFQFKHISKPFQFRLTQGSFSSASYQIELLQRPQIRSVQIKAVYPSHTSLPDAILNEVSEMSVPRGTILQWRVNTQHSEQLYFLSLDQNRNIPLKEANKYSFEQRINTETDIKLFAKRGAYVSDTLSSFIRIIEDEYPRLTLDMFQDSNLRQQRFFNLVAVDDYGFKDLHFVIERNLQDRTDTLINDILISKTLRQLTVSYSYDFSPLLIPGVQLSFYFVLRDNDAPKGYKQTVSNVFLLNELSQDEQKEQVFEQSKSIQSELSALIKQVKRDEKQLDRLKEKMLNDPQFNWEHKRMFEDLLESRLSTQKAVERLQNEMTNLRESQEKLDPETEELLEKQKQLEELMASLLDEETKALLATLQNLIKQDVDKAAIEKAVQQLEKDNLDLKQQMDQNLSLFKSLDFERKYEDALKGLERLQDSISKAKESVGQKGVGDSLRAQFQKLQKELDRMMDANSALEEPFSIQRDQAKEKALDDALKQAGSRKIDQKEKQKQDLQQAQDLAKQIESQLESQMASEQEDRTAEDARMVRRLLKSLISASQRQEALIDISKQTSVEMPAYQVLIRQQALLRQDLSMILDSLSAVSRRQVSVALLINETVSKLRQLSQDIQGDLLAMNDVMYRRSHMTNPRALYQQQLSMTAMNDMGLLLAESLKKMEESKSKGKGSCKQKKPGTGQSRPQLKDLQKQLNDKISELERSLREGAGKESREGRQKMSEALSKAAQQQEMIRRQLQEMAESLKRVQGKSDPQLQQIMEMMDQTERDLVNKSLGGHTIQRQVDIMTRLLESEKAQKEREQEERRESKESKVDFSAPNTPWDKNKERLKKSEETLQRFLPELNSFYKKLSSDYFNPTR